MQEKVVDIKFLNAGKSYKFLPGNLMLNIGDGVVVETSRGLEIGVVSKGAHTIEREDYSEPLKQVVRVSTNADEERMKQLEAKSKSIKSQIKKTVEDYKLEMKIVGVEISLDESKIVVSFTSEDRVDFRELVKELGSKYRARIELRQIGARDEVKFVGGIGPCGEVCCCSRFLEDFEHVSIKMPKVQGLSLNPVKISGLCGRLMCCLAYENQHYNETFKMMPRINSIVETPKGKATVVYNNLLKRKVQVRIGERGESGTEFVEFDLSEITTNQKNNVGFDDEVDKKSSKLEELED